MKKFFTFLLLFSFLLVADVAWAANSATITWNANTEPDLAGYKIYYGVGTYSGGTWTTPRSGTNPGTGTGKCGLCGYPASFNGVNNPISLGKVTTYAVNNLANGRYYFSVTAVDLSGNESAFSGDTTTTYKFVSGTADLNGIGGVGGQDFSILLGYWLSQSRPPADINQSGQVNGQDFSIMMGQWNS